MEKIKVLVVDDSVVIRKIVSDALAHDSSLEVVGVAANGKIALQKIPVLKPDILTLDMEMPEMDGLETLDHLKKLHPEIPVIMFSTLTQKGAAATLDALARGAVDYTGKPSNLSNNRGGADQIKNDLIPKIKNICARRKKTSVPASLNLEVKTPASASPSTVKTVLASPSLGSSRIDCVAIGVSTGGPNALSELMPVFPADFPVSILITQHMPPHFTKLLADRLAAKSNLEIVENKPGMLLNPGKAIIAAGDYHLTVHRKDNILVTGANQEPPENSCRPAVDVMFRSVSQVFGKHVLGVILTGMGQDGLKGCEVIKKYGGRIIIQDEATSVVWGMPGIVAKAGLAEKSLPLNKIGPTIIQMCNDHRIV
ncbi:MAG: chemotaxis response regulator protein-glutamate methylesterase [Candidatus Nitronauta litoralis]|uniref:Protein-glutamate methylesterase/protein-glutamine glutaminase n=1 Tax=Candidatus Nitronauta litoralis TaxID=2705533 RepID=A0A7T0G208_9BACT|nr:MAG: chemotaxis response regulator protein-glutamate methylesterase [Candidatus Nitronauta litoralis]